MNAKQRKQINKMISDLEQMKADAEMLQSDEQTKFENLTEGLQQADNGQKIEQAAEALGEIDSLIDEVISKLEEARDGQ